MNKLRAWVISLRLRTLPLALSTIFMGSIIAAMQQSFNANVFIWASITTLFLQILSNLANDYGDTVSGADNENRVGPQRMIQRGAITLNQMKKAIIITILLALTSGITLLLYAFEGFQWLHIIFFILGLLAIGAAIKYTIGKTPYGYRGLGDLYVFLFFGILGVAGTYFLHSQTWHWDVLLPASTIGLFSTGVLNLNNIRDIKADSEANKITLVVKMGRQTASFYHLTLIFLGWVTFILFTICNYTNPYQLLPILSLPFFIKNIIVVFTNKHVDSINNELRNLSLSTLLFVLLCAASLFFL